MKQCDILCPNMPWDIISTINIQYMWAYGLACLRGHSKSIWAILRALQYIDNIAIMYYSNVMLHVLTVITGLLYILLHHSSHGMFTYCTFLNCMSFRYFVKHPSPSCLRKVSTSILHQPQPSPPCSMPLLALPNLPRDAAFSPSGPPCRCCCWEGRGRSWRPTPSSRRAAAG